MKRISIKLEIFFYMGMIISGSYMFSYSSRIDDIFGVIGGAIGLIILVEGAMFFVITEINENRVKQLLLEVVFLSGINDTEEEEEALKDVIDTICPDRIQINTVVRPPSDSRAKSLDRERLEEIRLLLGKNAEVIAATPFGKEGLSGQSSAKSLLDTVKRRPLRAIDIVNSLDLDPDDVKDLIKGLLIKGYIRKQEHSGEIFYLSNEEDSQ